MYSSNPGFPVTIIYYTKNRTLYKVNLNSKSTFNSILENFEHNYRYKNEAKLKSKYFLNGREIRKTQLLEELINQNEPYSSSNLDKAELLVELEELHFTGDSSYQSYKKIIQPKRNPFGLYIYVPREGTMSLKSFPTKTITLFELNKFDEGSAYCNSYNDLFISGGKSEKNRDFWIINNNNFEVKKKNMLVNKKYHSMIYLNFHQNEEWVFIIGGDDKKTFYYDLKKNYFMNWGDINDIHLRPALLKIGEYLYIFDSINLKKNYFERTNIISPNKRWEKANLNVNNKIINNFPSRYAVSFDSNGKILLLGGDKYSNINNTYIYEPDTNQIILSQNRSSDKILFDDKTFYKINNRYNIGFPQNLNETKEICVVDKEEQSLMKIYTELPSENNKGHVKCNLSFSDIGQNYSNNTKDNLTIKATNTKINENYFNQSNLIENKYNKMSNNKYNQKSRIINYNQSSLINNNNYNQSPFDSQYCHNNSNQTNNYSNYKSNYNNYNYNNNYKSNYNNYDYKSNYNNYTQQKSYNIQNKYIQNTKINIQYNKNQNVTNPTRQNPKITIIQDEYFPTVNNIYKQTFNKSNKVNYKVNYKPYKKVYNKNYNRGRDKAKVVITYDEYIPIKIDYELKKPVRTLNNNVKKQEIIKNEVAINNKNLDSDVVEYKNYENNEQENKDNDLFVSEEQNKNEVIIEENNNNVESNFNEDREEQPETNEEIHQEQNVIEGKGEEDENKNIEQNNDIEDRGEFIEVEKKEKNNVKLENGEENIEKREIDNIEYNNSEKEGMNEEINIKEENNVLSQNKEITNGELQKDSLEFNNRAKIQEEGNDLEPQKENDNFGEEENNKEEIYNENENNNEINIQENNNNVMVNGEEFHSMDENEEQDNSVEHIEHIENENEENEENGEMYENGNEIKFENENENIDNNGEENEENIIKDEEENKIIEYDGEEGEEMIEEEVEVGGEEGEEGEELMNGGEEGEGIYNDGEEEMNDEGMEEMNNNEQMEEENNSVIENNVENEEQLQEHEQEQEENNENENKDESN